MLRTSKQAVNTNLSDLTTINLRQVEAMGSLVSELRWSSQIVSDLVTARTMKIKFSLPVIINDLHYGCDLIKISKIKHEFHCDYLY